MCLIYRSKKTSVIILLLCFIAVAVLIGGCVQLPKSSVKLSDSISDDLISMQESHKAFVNYYYDSLERQANNLIDTKYRPSLIRSVIEQDVAKFSDPAMKEQSLFNCIQEAFINNQNLGQTDLEEAQANAMAGMKIFYTKIDEKVEAERRNLLDPLREQRQALLGEIDANYINIIKKNAAITALLNSVAEVHDVQEELFSIAGIKEDMRTEIGAELAELADRIEKIQGVVDESTVQVEDVEKALDDFEDIIRDR